MTLTALGRGCRLLLLSYLAAACSVSRYSSYAELGAAGPVPHARVWLVGNGTAYDLEDVVALDDSVIGFSPRGRERFAFARAAVDTIETRTISPLRTAGAIVGVAAGIVVILGAILAYAITHSRNDF